MKLLSTVVVKVKLLWFMIYFFLQPNQIKWVHTIFIKGPKTAYYLQPILSVQELWICALSFSKELNTMKHSGSRPRTLQYQ